MTPNASSMPTPARYTRCVSIVNGVVNGIVSAAGGFFTRMDYAGRTDDATVDID